MQSNQRVVQLAAGGSDKPVAPVDLWERLDELNRAVSSSVQPEGGFTAMEFQEQFGLSMSVAYKRLRQMVRAGDVEKMGKWYRLTSSGSQAGG
jgi:hypothetical protein